MVVCVQLESTNAVAVTALFVDDQMVLDRISLRIMVDELRGEYDCDYDYDYDCDCDCDDYDKRRIKHTSMTSMSRIR